MCVVCRRCFICRYVYVVGMSHEVENLIEENRELLATKLVNLCFVLTAIVDCSTVSGYKFAVDNLYWQDVERFVVTLLIVLCLSIGGR